MVRINNIPSIKNLTTEEKERIIYLIDTFSALAKQARTEGILAMEESLEEVKNPYLVSFLRFVIDGFDESFISANALNLLAIEGITPVEKLEILVSVNAALCIQTGMNPDLGKILLSSLLGSEFYFETVNNYSFY